MWSFTGSGVPCSLCTASPWAPTSSLQSECPSAGSALSATRELAGLASAGMSSAAATASASLEVEGNVAP